MQRKFRLKNSRSFSLIYNKGESVSDRLAVLMWMKSRDGGLKVGFTVSRKIGNSVVRNRVKRRMREAFRLLIPKIENGYTYILLARSPAVEADYARINASITSLLARSGRLKADSVK